MEAAIGAGGAASVVYWAAINAGADPDESGWYLPVVGGHRNGYKDGGHRDGHEDPPKQPQKEPVLA